MKYFKFTKVDAETGISANIQKPINGEVLPALDGLEIVFQSAIISEYWYGTADDTAVENPDNQCWELTLTEFAADMNDTVERIKQNRLVELGVTDKNLRDDLLGYYHITALLAGVNKYEQAKSVVIGDEDIYDEIHLEAQVRGIPVLTLANSVIAKRERYVRVDALITGMRGMIEDRIEAFSVDLTDPLASWQEFNSLEDVNGNMISKYGIDIMGRIYPLLVE